MKKLLKVFYLVLMVALFSAVLSLSTSADAEANSITYEGLAMRVKSDLPGLRSLFSVDLDEIEALEAEGYTVEFGAVMGIVHEASTFRQPSDLSVEKHATKGFVSPAGSDVVCVYSSLSAGYATNKFVSYDENKGTATFAYTLLYRPAQQTLEWYNMGIVHASFLYLEKDGVSEIRYEYPLTENSICYDDGSVTLYEMTDYWSTRLPSASEQENIVKVLNSAMPESITVTEKTATKAAPLSIAASGVKPGIYAVNAVGTASASAYYLVDADGDVARNRVSGAFDCSLAHVYLDGDSTVTIIPESGTHTYTSISLDLVYELRAEDAHHYSMARDMADNGALDSFAGDIINMVKNPLTGQYAPYFDGDRNSTASFTLDTGLSAGLYRVGVFYTANNSLAVSYGLDGEEATGSFTVPKSVGFDGSTSGGYSFAWLGEVAVTDENNTLRITPAQKYVNITSVVLVTPRYTVDFYDADNTTHLSRQSVAYGGTAVVPSPKKVSGYTYPSQQTLDVSGITADTSFTLHASRDSLTASVAKGTLTSTAGNKDDAGRLVLASGESGTITLTGATAGYYEVSLDYPGTALNYLYITNSAEVASFCARLAAGSDGSAVMTVWLEDGDNTLKIKPSGSSVAISSVTFRNVTDAYKAVRIPGTASGCLTLSTGGSVVYEDVSIPFSGEYTLAIAGCTTTAGNTILLSNEAGETLLEEELPLTDVPTSSATVFIPISFTTFYLEEGTQTLTLSLSAGKRAYLDALVLIPHEYHDFEELDSKKATCMETGYTSSVCRCGTEDYEEIPLQDHKYRYVVTAEASCFSNGLSEEMCIYCSEATGNQKEVPQTDHSLASEVQQATCAAEGFNRTYCTLCDEVISEEVIAKTRHKNAYIVEKEATCTAEGYEVQKCMVCGTPTGNRVTYPPTGAHEGRWTVLNEPTAQKQGYAVYKCIHCDGTLENKKLSRLKDSSYVGSVKATNLSIASGATYATMKVEAPTAGFYEIRIQGHASTSKYYKLANITFDETIFSSQKDYGSETLASDTSGFVVYLLEGTNTLKYSIRSDSSTEVTLTGATAHLISPQSVEAYVGTGQTAIPEYKTGTYTFGEITVANDGFYRISAYMAAFSVKSLSMTLMSTQGSEYNIPIDVSSPEKTPIGSTGAVGYDAFGVIYLPAGQYTISLTVETTNKLAVGGFFLSPVTEPADIYYIHIDRAMISGTGTGTESDPYVLNTVEGAYQRILALVNQEGRSDINVSMSGGKYKLEDTLVINGDDFITTDYSITFVGAATDRPVSDIYAGVTDDLPTLITSLTDITGSDFTAVAGTNYYSYQLPESARLEDESGNLVYPAFRDLYVDGVAQKMASSRPVNLRPAGVDDYKMYKDTAKRGVAGEISGVPTTSRLLYLHPSAVGDVELDASGNVIGELEYWVHTEWQTQMVHIEKIYKNPSPSFTATAEYSPLGQSETLWACRVPEDEWNEFINAYYSYLEKCVYYMKNNIAYLDEAGEFFYDQETGTIYLCPDGDISKMTVSFPGLENLVELYDTHNITFDNVNFTGTTVNFPTENAYFSGQGGRLKNLDENGKMIDAFMPNGAVYGNNVRNISFFGCDLSELGGDAINFRGVVTDITVSDCRFVNVGGTAVRLGFGRRETAKETRYTENAVITQNYIRNTGAVYTLCTAIHVTAVRNLEISYNTILDSAYSAISIGWSWDTVELTGLKNMFNVEKAVVSNNYIENFMTQMQDGGAIYVLGGNASRNTSGYLNSINNNLVVATPSTGNGVNRFTVFYHDEGSSHWHDYDNVLVLDPDTLRLRNGVIAYQTITPAYNNLTERLYFIGYQDDRDFDTEGNQTDYKSKIQYMDEDGNKTAVTSKDVSLGWLFTWANPAADAASGELKNKYFAYINPDGSYTTNAVACLEGKGCPLVGSEITSHNHHNTIDHCYKYTNFANAQSSAQYASIEAIVTAAGCNGAKGDIDAIAAMFDNAPIHCPACWSTNVKAVSGKGYRCYDCQPKRTYFDNLDRWYFSLFQ